MTSCWDDLMTRRPWVFASQQSTFKGHLIIKKLHYKMTSYVSHVPLSPHEHINIMEFAVV